MAGGVGRTDRTPYIIYALAAVQAAVGTYYGSRNDAEKAVQALADRVTTMEASNPIRREMRDRQMQDLSERLRRLEERGRR